MFSVQGKVVLITGASRGIGKALATGFAASGAVVYGTGSRPESIAWMEATAIKGRAADAKDPAALNAVIANIIKEHGRLDCLINNAGIAPKKPAASLKEDDVDDILDVNFRSAFRACQQYYKLQKNGGGNIINNASVFGLLGYPLSSVYCSSKGALIQMTRALAAEWARKGFRVNALCPGFIDTGMTDVMKENADVKASMLSRVPMNRLGRPDEIVPAAIFLASDASSYITGQTLTVDGGLTCN